MANNPDLFSPARLELADDGTPYSADYDDTYYSRAGGLEETRHVFLQANGLPEAWQERALFTIAETGFGTGLNFLAAWQLWRQTAPPDGRLHFISVEKHPYSPADLQRLFAARPLFPDLEAELLAQYPHALPGFHRLHLDGGRVCLSLLYGDVHEVLPELQAEVDCWFLDGFAPARNPAMWTPALYDQMARLTRPGGTFATFTAAGHVRRGLEAAGFVVEKIAGFGHKREMLRGTRREEESDTSRAYPLQEKPWFHLPNSRRPGTAIIIGAGMAGSACAERLAARGWKIQLIDRHPQPAMEASGNPAGILLPVLASERSNALSRIAITGYHYALRQLKRLQDDGHDLHWGRSGVLRLCRNPRHCEQQDKIAEKMAFPPEFAQRVSRERAAELAGVEVSQPGWYFPEGAWVEPASLCRASLTACGERLVSHHGREVARLESHGGRWQALDAAGKTIAEGDIVILANAADAQRLSPAENLPLQAIRGQVSYLRGEQIHASLQRIVCREGYVIPATGGLQCFGASFNKHAADLAISTEEHAENLQRLDSIAPTMAAGVDAASLDGRTAWRCATPDRLPVYGPLADEAAYRHDYAELHHKRRWQTFPTARYQPGLYAALGLGARGLVWAQLGAELLASQISGEPLPLEESLVEALHPARFLVRELKKKPA